MALQIDEDELKFQEAVHFSEPTADPVVTGLDILDEDDRTPGLDPDKMGAPPPVKDPLHDITTQCLMQQA